MKMLISGSEVKMLVSQVLPSQVQDVLTAVDRFDLDGLAVASPQERAAWVVGLRRIVDRAEAAFQDALGTFDAHGDGETLVGARSTAAWLRSQLKLAPGDGAERVRLARHSGAHLKPTIALLQQNEITFEQVRAVGQAVRQLPSGAIDAGVEILNELAMHADAGTVRVAGRRLRAAVDPDGALAAADQDYQRRRLSLSPLLDGMVHLEGLLDAEAATTVTTALAPFLVPAEAEDNRSTQQRRADGLVELARLALDHNKLGDLGGNPPRIEVACSLPTLIAQPGAAPALLAQAPGGPAPLTRIGLERLGCDATVARVLTTAAGVPVDLGQDTRLFTPSQRKALSARDGGCRFPGCDREPAFTDAHHIKSWLNGGVTSLANGVLLCRFHHRKVHGGGWTISPDDAATGANGELTFDGPLGQRLRAPTNRNPRAP